MKLENLALEMPKLKGEVKVYQLVDLAYMSPAGLYGSGDSGKYTDKYGESVSWGQSFGRSTDYIKQTELGELHVHAPKGFVTGANLNGKPISNYEASIIDLLPGKIIKDTGKW